MDSDLDYCRKSVERSDYDHYLISLLMSADKRPCLWTLGAFKNVIETIPSSVSEPALGYMRLTWWRDQIELLAGGAPTKGQPVLSALKKYCHACESGAIVDFINEHEALIENPESGFVSMAYPGLLKSLLGNEYARYQKLQNTLTKILKKHHGSKWEHNPPFLALRLWCAALIN